MTETPDIDIAQDGPRGAGTARLSARPTARNARPERSAYRNRLADGLDQGLFFIIFLIGGLGIIALKELDLPQLTVTCFPVALMLLYALYVSYGRRYRLRDDRAGDNLYYLGFLFTLISLGYSLWSFSGEVDSTQQIIENFGLALATTIIGLALRILFNQMREDHTDVERQARLSLGEAVSRLKAELDVSVTELALFRHSTQQSLAEGMTEVSRKSADILEGHGERLTMLTEKLAVKLEEDYAALNDDRRQMREAARKIAKAIEDLVRRLEAVKVPSDMIEAKLTPAVEKLVAAAEQVGAATAAQVANGEQLTRLVETALASSKTLEAHIGALLQASDAQRHQMAREGKDLVATAIALKSGMEGSLALVQQTVDQQKATLDGLARAAAANLATAEAHRRAMEDEVRQSRELTVELHQALASLARVTAEKLGPQPASGGWSDAD